MNKARRARIQDLAEQLSTIRGEFQEITDEEQEAFDNMPESLQGSEKGQQIEGNIEILGDVGDSLDEIAEWLGAMD